MLELEAVKRLVPKGQRTLITQDFIDKIEAGISDPIAAETIKDNFITYLNVLSQGKYKMEDYLNAIKYVSHKLLGRTNIDAYAATFPERYQRLVKEGQQIDAYASMYNSNKLVNQIFEQTRIPSYILNAPIHQEALNTLAGMIHDPAVKGMTKVKACEAILAHTKPPEIIKNEHLIIGVEQQSTISELREITENLANTFKVSLEKGQKTLKEITEVKIIDITPEEEEEE